MLGKVHGPYVSSSGHEHVIIILHNEDGSIKERKTLPYKKYLEEVDNGLHVYKSYVKSLPKKQKRSFEEIERNRPKLVTCVCCKKEFISKIIRGEFVGYLCSKNCGEKFRRKLKKRIKPTYYNQIVIPINFKRENKYYIIIENKQGKRIAKFVSVNKCSIIITEDNNFIQRIKLSFNDSDAVRIKPVLGYKKYFWITENGILISRRTKNILSQEINPSGYLTHATKIGGRNGQTKCFRIHRLVGIAFIPNPDNKPEINHKDGIKSNNFWTNLEWATSLENTQHAWENGLCKPLRGELSSSAKLSNLQANEIRELFATGKYSYSDLSQLFNVSLSIIGNCVRNDSYIV